MNVEGSSHQRVDCVATYRVPALMVGEDDEHFRIELVRLIGQKIHLVIHKVLQLIAPHSKRKNDRRQTQGTTRDSASAPEPSLLLLEIHYV
jgi:hypothetical protein